MKVKVHKVTEWRAVVERDGEKLRFPLTHEAIEDSVLVQQRPEDKHWGVGYLVRDDDPPGDPLGDNKIIDRRHACKSEIVKHYNVGRVAGYEDPDEWHEVELPLSNNKGIVVRHRHFNVMLDVYSHSGDVWRVNGSDKFFPDAKWDVGFCCGIWCPSKDMIDSLRYSALKTWFPEGDEVKYSSVYVDSEDKLPERLKKYAKGCRLNDGSFHFNEIVYVHDDVQVAGDFQTFTEAATSLLEKLEIRVDPQELRQREQDEAVKAAASDVEIWNDYIAGNNYGVVLEEYDENFEQIEDDSCWGYVGERWASQERDERMRYWLAKIPR